MTGDAGVLFDPTSPADIADTILSVWNDGHRLAAMRQRGLARARDFSWEQTAWKTQDGVSPRPRENSGLLIPEELQPALYGASGRPGEGGEYSIAEGGWRGPFPFLFRKTGPTQGPGLLIARGQGYSVKRFSREKFSKRMEGISAGHCHVGDLLHSHYT